jgi:glutamine synthetase
MAKPYNDEGGLRVPRALLVPVRGRRAAVRRSESPDGLSATARHAIAGILRHAPALAAVSNPTINSYKRFGPDTLAPWLIDWGLDNRSAMVRVPPERGSAARLEVRLGDASANPYLVDRRAARRRRTSASATSSRRRRRSRATATTRAARPRLPGGLATALDALEQDKELTDVLGEQFVRTFLTYKRNEIERFNRFVTDWEFREYTYHL